MDRITVSDRSRYGVPPLVTLTYHTPRTGPLGIRDYIEPRREYVGMGFLPAAIRAGMQSGGVIMRLPRPKGVAA